jgi:CRISPR/Cas system-associated endonuclease Cas3-HD
MIRVLRGSLQTLTAYAERDYLSLLKFLASRKCDPSITDFIKKFQSSSISEILVVFHDLGKCTLPSQESLRKNCTAPYHEILSATLLLAYLTFLGSCCPAVAGPPVLAVLLHHHAMRGLDDVRHQIQNTQINTRSEDLKCVLKCLNSLLKVVDLPQINEFSSWISSQDLGKYIRGLAMFIDSLKVGGKEEHLLTRIYKSSILLTAVLSIADNVAASENRKYCGKVQVREVQQIEILHGFIRYLLDRELNREKITKTFRKALGINWVSSKT